MNSMIECRRKTRRFVITLLLTHFALAPLARAVVPAPDGGYPGANTAEGQNALLRLTTGGFNTAVGWLALSSNTESDFNTAIGAGALLANVSGANTATGAGALFSTTTGGNNTADGVLALFSNTTGQSNTATGAGALFSNMTADNNTANGFHALFSNTEGVANTATGLGALQSNITGDGNIANGVTALGSNTSGDLNTAVGNSALVTNTTGSFNTALGAGAGNMVTTADNVICIRASGANVNDSCFIGNIWNQPGGSQAVYVNSDGKLGAQVSSRRFKDEIKPIEGASDIIYELKPVSFRYKAEIEPSRPRGFGLIAEDVQKVNPDLVMCDADGNPASVRYDVVNAMLLNEFLKEHKKVADQQATIAELKSTVAQQQKRFARQEEQIAALTSGLQRVSAQLATRSRPRGGLEMSKCAPEIAANK